MELKITKGELKVNPLVNGHGFDVSFNDDGECVVDVVDKEADAHLIAAAPDMYKLLQQFLPRDEDGNGWDFIYDEGSEGMGEEVIKLLAKARGE